MKNATLLQSFACAVLLLSACAIQAGQGPNVTAMTPAPNSTLTAAPTSITATLSGAINAGTVSSSSVQLLRAGMDGAFGTGDDVVVTPTSISVVNANQIKIDLPAGLPSDKYKVRLASRGSGSTVGLAAYWAFDAGTGTVAADSSGNGRNGTINGATWTTGVKGNALSFNGVTNAVTLSTADIPPPWTLGVWVNKQATANPTQTLMHGTTGFLKLEQFNNTKQVGFTIGPDYSFNYQIPVNTWTHLTYVGTASSTTLYVNGVQVDSMNVSLDLPMGQIGDTIHWTVNGTLDEMRAYGRALSASEVQTLAGGLLDLNGNALDGEYPGIGGGLSSFPSGDSNPGGDFVAQFEIAAGLIAHYKFDEATGATAIDSSGNGNNGTIVDTPARTHGVFGSALDLNGTTNEVIMPDSLICNNPNVTFTAFFNTTKLGVILGYQSGPQGYIPAVYVGVDGKLRGEYWNGNPQPITSAIAVADGKWHHVALTGATNTQSLYLDGNLIGTLNGLISHGATPKNQLGRGITSVLWPSTTAGSADDVHFTGKLDDARIYNRALSGSEIQALASRPTISNGEAFTANSQQQLVVVAPGVLSNDQAAAGATLASAVLDGNVLHGALALNANGSFTYTPTSGFIGIDSFTYHAIDSSGGASVPVTVTIDVYDITVTSISKQTGGSGELLTGVVVTGTGFRVAPMPNPPGTVSFNGHNYLLVTTVMGHANAKAHSESLGGHLVTIGSAPENDFVKNLAQAFNWIGFNDEAMQGAFVWVTGEPVTYTNWNAGEPKNNGGPEHWAVQLTNGGWNDAEVDLLRFVCEFETRVPMVKLKKGNSVINGFVRFDSSTQLTVDFNLTGAGPGLWDVTVTDPLTGVDATLPAAFQVTNFFTSISVGTPAAIIYKSTAQNITLSAAITPSSGTVNEGNVTFELKNGTTIIGNAVASGTIANNSTGNVTYVLPAGTAAGTYTVSATYNGTANYSGSVDTSKTLTINKIPLTVTANSNTRVYGAANPSFTGTLTGVQVGDGITASYTTTATANSAVGPYPITPTLDDPNNKLGNYNVTSTDGTLTITKAAITVTTLNSSRLYGAANPIFSGTLLGVLNGDNILANYDSNTTATTPAGIYPIVPTLVDPDSRLGNYTVNSSNGTLTIGKAAITATADNLSRQYGTPNPVLTGTISGVQNGENISANYSTAATPSSAPGVYPILVAGLNDPDSKLANYTTTLNNGELTVTKATPAINWPQPAAVVAGTILGPAQLNASAADANTGALLIGTFEYTPAAGTVLLPGAQQLLSVTFTPEDSTNYTKTPAQRTLDVTPAIAPIITSPLNANSPRHAEFTYTITADGSVPMTFNAEGLPAGLTFSGANITGAPTATGVFYIKLTANNFAGSDSKLLRLIVAQPENNAPQIISLPAASPNPATAGSPVIFTAIASDPDNDSLDFTWDFGDATGGQGASTSKVYTTPGVYIVKLSVTDGVATVTQTLNVAIQEQPDVTPFKIEKVKLALNFVKKGKDSISVSGQVPLAANFVPAGKSVRVLIGLLDRESKLTSKGKSEDKTFALKFKPGATSAGFSFNLKNADLAEKLAPLGSPKRRRRESWI